MSRHDFSLEPAHASPYGAQALPDVPSVEDGAPATGGLWARLGLLLGALLALGTVLAHVNPSFGFLFYDQGVDALHWPWELLTGLTDGTFRWTPPTAWVLSLGGAGVLLLLAACLQGGRLRASLALGAFALLATTLLPLQKHVMLYAGRNVALALLAGAAFAARAHPAAARRVGVVATLVLAALLLLPLPSPPQDPEAINPAEPPYASVVTQTVEAYHAVLTGAVEAPPGETPMPRLLFVAHNPHGPSWMLGAVLGLLLVLGVRGRILAVPLALLVLIVVLTPPTVRALGELSAAREEAPVGSVLTSMEEVGTLGRAAGVELTAMLRLSLLPLALGLADLLRARRR